MSVSTVDLLQRLAAIAEAREQGYADRRPGHVVNSECADALVRLLPELLEVAKFQASTRGDQYRAELYDEVWGKARAMGYPNVVGALVALEKLDGVLRLGGGSAGVSQ